MRLGRPLVPLELTTEEQTLLESWARRRTTAQALALRARIVLRAAAGDSNTALARHERVTKATVGKWRARFVRERTKAGVLDAIRRGRTLAVDGDGHLAGDPSLIQLLGNARPAGRVDTHPAWRRLSVAIAWLGALGLVVL